MFTAPKLVKYHALFAKEIEYIGAYRGKMGGSNLRISRNTQFINYLDPILLVCYLLKKNEKG